MASVRGYPCGPQKSTKLTRRKAQRRSTTPEHKGSRPQETTRRHKKAPESTRKHEKAGRSRRRALASLWALWCCANRGFPRCAVELMGIRPHRESTPLPPRPCAFLVVWPASALLLSLCSEPAAPLCSGVVLFLWSVCPIFCDPQQLMPSPFPRNTRERGTREEEDTLEVGERLEVGENNT